VRTFEVDSAVSSLGFCMIRCFRGGLILKMIIINWKWRYNKETRIASPGFNDDRVCIRLRGTWSGWGGGGATGTAPPYSFHMKFFVSVWVLEIIIQPERRTELKFEFLMQQINTGNFTAE
jgi:hypothetical protein